MIDKQSILAEIRDYSLAMHESVIPPDCVTYQDVRKELSCSHSKAQTIMRRLVETGKFERLELGGKVKVVFRRIGA